MDNTFDQAVNQVVSEEGDVSDDKNDPGGYTKYGISLKLLQDVGLHILHDDIISINDVNAISVDDAKKIYYQYFWIHYNIFLIKSPEIEEKVFDLSVNMGGQEAIRLLQEAINRQLQTPIAADGIIGALTLHALNQISLITLMQDYRQNAADYYRYLAANNPRLEEFLPGWLSRAER